MNWNAVEVYVRENQFMMTWIVAGVFGLCLLWILFQVTLTRREVHKICKKVRKYFDVILTEEECRETVKLEEIEPESVKAPLYESEMDYKNEKLKKQRDAELLMEVISEVF